MRAFKSWAASLTLLASLCVSPLLAEESKWVDLFDGKSLKGWEAMAEGDVKVVDGEIQILAVKKNLWLLHETEFEDFELEAEVLMPAEPYNSGLGFRCSKQETGKKKMMGYQCEVAEKLTGAVYAIGKGWVNPSDKSKYPDFFKVAGDCYKTQEWNKLRVKCVGKRIQVWVNGHLTSDVENDFFSKGRIALQHHGKGDVHRFKNIKIKAL